MSQITVSPVRQHARTAAIAAAGVAAVLLVQDLIGIVSTVMVGYSQAENNSGTYLGYLWQSIGFGLLLLLAFAGGVFLSLWLVAQVSRSLTVMQVVLRGMLAAVVGAAAVLALSFVLEMIGPMSGAGTLFGNSFPWPDLSSTAQAFSVAVQRAVHFVVQQAPVVVLVAVLLWIWLGKHPSRHAGSSDAGEV
jgi:hypothetical protein